MLDLETMGTSSDAPIMAIGVQAFDPTTNELGDTFYQGVTLKSNGKAGRIPDPNTIEWWLKQSKEAQDGLFAGDRSTLQEALNRLRNWMNRVSNEQRLSMRYAKLWSKGPTFDEVILNSALLGLNMDPLTRYYNSRCVRTIEAQARDFGIELPEMEGTTHNARADAIHQAKVVNAVYAGLRR